MSNQTSTGESALEKRSNAPLPILFFDSRCLLCHRSVRWIIRHDPEGIFSFAGLDSKTANECIPSDHPLRSADTVILLDEEGLHGHSDVVFRTVRQLKTFAKILVVFSVLPRRLTDWAYRFIAARRYRWFGKDDSCPLPDPEAADRFLD